jgi:hypothetical protein
MNPLLQCKPTILPLLIAGVLACFGLLPKALAVVPAPDGGYPGFNTAEGQNALFSLATGVANTGVGWYSLWSNTEGSFNTALGAGTLPVNTAEGNTATGAGALLSNTTGEHNTGSGGFALFSNTTGVANTADGYEALLANTTGSYNTADGRGALLNNTTGGGNTANGLTALGSNINGGSNTAIGANALSSNTAGDDNTAVGSLAGFNITGSGNVCIGQGVFGDGDVDDTTWIRNVYDSVAVTRTVYVNQDNKIGTLASTRRVKDDIKPMDNVSETILALKPVTFRYKREIDRYRAPQFGLIAEDVAQVNPDLITQDQNGEPYTVRYEAINAMLLNEFLKEHRKVEKLEATVLEQQKQVKALTAGLENVSAEIQMIKAAPNVARTQ